MKCQQLILKSEELSEQCSLFEETNEELEYKAFVDKFKPKLTTDDCYTPPAVYEVVKNYCIDRYGIDEADIVRPFWPGGDYENYPYKPTDVVVDNPPFSILTKICRFYSKRGIKFFLFAPYLTVFQASGTIDEVTHIVCDVGIVYKNGAVVNTSFSTNLEPAIKVRNDIVLNEALEIANAVGKRTATLPKYKYENHVLTASMLGYMAKQGVPFAVEKTDCIFIRCLDAQKAKGKGIFGGGFLLSEKAAAEKAAAEKAAAEKAAAEKAAAEKAAAEKAAAEKACVIPWELSERELEIVKSLGGG